MTIVLFPFLVFLWATPCYGEELRLLTWDAGSIKSLRNAPNIRNLQSTALSVSLLHLWKETQHDLDVLRNEGLPSVTNKKETVPGAGGDKTYYVSVVPYAFPCNAAPPDCMDYHGMKYKGVCSAKGLPWIICDGKINAKARDNTDRPRLERMMNRVIRLSLAGYIFKDAVKSTAAADMLRAWFLDPATAMRPSLRFGQGIPGVSFGRSSSCMDLYFSGRGFVDAVLLLNQTPGLAGSWTRGDQRGMSRWASAMAHYMATSAETIAESRMANNHGVFFDLTVLALAVLGDDERSRALARRISGDAGCWTARGAKRWCLEGRFASQIDGAGKLVHEVVRADPGHYVWYTLLASAYLAATGAGVGNDAGFATQHVQLAADWALPHVTNGKGARIEGQHVYAVHAYRILARGLRNQTYEDAVCRVLTAVANKSKHRFWSTDKVGVDILTITMPPYRAEGSSPCAVWAGFLALEGSREFLSWRQSKVVLSQRPRARTEKRPLVSFHVSVAGLLTVTFFAFFAKRIRCYRKLTFVSKYFKK